MELIENMVKSIPWGHNQRIMYKCQSIQEALFYVQKTMDNGWSRNVLEHQIDSDLYNRQGKAVSNFQLKLPEVQSDLAQQTLKDPYNFDFLTLREEYDEKELEDALVNQITQFLLELGTGFSYLGRQVHLHVGESDFYMAARAGWHGSIGRGLRRPDTTLGEDHGPAWECVLCVGEDSFRGRAQSRDTAYE